MYVYEYVHVCVRACLGRIREAISFGSGSTWQHMQTSGPMSCASQLTSLKKGGYIFFLFFCTGNSAVMYAVVFDKPDFFYKVLLL
jgi:hypothetical protein